MNLDIKGYCWADESGMYCVYVLRAIYADKLSYFSHNEIGLYVRFRILEDIRFD